MGLRSQHAPGSLASLESSDLPDSPGSPSWPSPVALEFSLDSVAGWAEWIRLGTSFLCP